MPKIKIITSNFLNSKSSIGFEDGLFKYGREKSSSELKTMDCTEVKTLTYKKPGAHTSAHRRKGLIAAFKNVFSAAKSIKSANQIEFDVHFKDGRYLVGVTSWA